ncbi:MAG TPA: GtrA family protein [Anaerolineaceae bacterium]|nr:GtrA family protein [Anaerolineaceae bacterium]HNY99838.1 GtrA family protein [Anaerolineaceae bacterium]HOD44038.1 GtrA family protein [Anaerolineaceae bacterium]HOH18769.1 GtrA family protein [Anaerolineaceae bacterium]
MILNNARERVRFFRFAAVGALGSVVDFGVFNLLVHFGIPSILSSAISFILAVINNFLWNRYWTYPDSRSKSLGNQLIQFSLVSLVGMGIRAFLFILIESHLIEMFERFSWKISLSPTFLGHNSTLTIAILVVLIWNFLANRYWTYNDISAE